MAISLEFQLVATPLQCIVPWYFVIHVTVHLQHCNYTAYLVLNNNESHQEEVGLPDSQWFYHPDKTDRDQKHSVFEDQ